MSTWPDNLGPMPVDDIRARAEQLSKCLRMEGTVRCSGAMPRPFANQVCEELQRLLGKTVILHEVPPEWDFVFETVEEENSDE